MCYALDLMDRGKSCFVPRRGVEVEEERRVKEIEGKGMAERLLAAAPLTVESLSPCLDLSSCLSHCHASASHIIFCPYSQGF